MVESCLERVAALLGNIKKGIDGFMAQNETVERVTSTVVKVVLIALIPFYLLFVFFLLLCTFVCRLLYQGVVFILKILKKAGGFICKGARALYSFARFVFGRLGRTKKILSIIGKGILFLWVPPLFVLLLVVILLSKVFPYLYKWIAYGITAMRAILVLVENNRGMEEEPLEDMIEATGFSYDPKQDIFYSTLYPWQRKFGYCRLYDEAAAVWGMIVDCEPVYFEYNGKKWLIEFWKGQYDLSLGCEMGVYTTEGPSLEIPGVFNGTFFESGSDEDLLEMSLRLLKNNQVVFTREGEHWWLTGFKVGEFANPSELTMSVTITLKDIVMCSVFVRGLKRAGYSDKEITRNGRTVSFLFDKPKTSQPFTRMKLTDWMIQKKNRHMCKKFKKLTGENTNMQEKIEIIKEKAPRLYEKIIRIGKGQKLYRKCQKVNRYLN